MGKIRTSTSLAPEPRKVHYFKHGDMVRLVDPNRPDSAVEGTLRLPRGYSTGKYAVYTIIREDGTKYRSEGILEQVK